MLTDKKILAILAHPDDETLGVGRALSFYANLGVETHLICATLGQRGWFGSPEDNPGEEALGEIRRNELLNAAKVLRIQSVTMLELMDGELDQVAPNDIVPELATKIQEIQPDVVLTFDPFGCYGHPDHIAISQFTTAAVMQAASGSNAHPVDGLYYFVMTQEEADSYEAAFGELIMNIDGVERRTSPWVDWSISTRIDTSACVSQIWEAVRCHQSQLLGYERLLDLPEEHQRAIFGQQTFYRAFDINFSGRQQANTIFVDHNPSENPPAHMSQTVDISDN